MMDDVVVKGIDGMEPFAFVGRRDILRAHHAAIDVQHGTAQQIALTAASLPEADVSREAAMQQPYLVERMHGTGMVLTAQVVGKDLPEGRKILRGVVLTLELLAGAFLVAMEIKDQMADRELDSETAKVLAEARSLPQTALRAIRGAATQGAGTKKRTTDTRI